ncbi:DUF2304 domain-containing protein [Streptococcus sp. E17BB]|uniref:DUF2304 domain-containing protein n=1 Tax=Streptococcus sp. E17BB TaxID=3278714 RepID=UPI00359D16CF
MTITASLFISVVIISFLLWLGQLIRKHRLAIKYSLYWVILSLVLLIVVWFPGILGILSKVLGVYSETNLVFFVGFCLSLWIIFWLTNTVSLQSQKIKKLTQAIALIENKEKRDDGSD